MQDHPAELVLRLGHSDSYTGVSQSTLMRQLLTTSGQGNITKECLPSSSQIFHVLRTMRIAFFFNKLPAICRA